MRNLLAVACLTATLAAAQNEAPAQGNAPQQLQNQQQTTTAPAPPRPNIASTNLVETFNGPTLSEVYCAGFISKAALHPSATVLAGSQAPEQVSYADNGYIYLSGSDVQEGKEYQLLRDTIDPNKYESYPGQLATLQAMGELYQDMGRAKVLYVRNKVGVAQIESTCSGTMPADIAVPFQERPRPEFKQTSFDQFAAPNGKTTGRIVMGRDLDTVFGSHRIVYLNIGENQGVKPGDYFRVTRNYSAVVNDPAESIDFNAPAFDDTQKHPSTFNARTQHGELPRR